MVVSIRAGGFLGDTVNHSFIYMVSFRKHVGEEKKLFARRLRKNQTYCERRLWSFIRSRRLRVKFRRQAIILGYIVDFFCPQEKLIIEIDGKIHNSPERKEYDETRTLHLSRKGFKIIRFTNEQVLYDLQGVLTEIRNSILL